MKYLLLVIGLFSISFVPSNAQDYSEMMQRQKEILAQHKSINIIIDLATYQEDKLNPKLSYRTEIYTKEGKLYSASPDMKIIQHERGCLIVQELEKIIFYSSFKTPIDKANSIASNLQKWDEALKKYVTSATSIERVEASDYVQFIIRTKNPLAKEARIKFHKSTDMMLGMDLIQDIKDGQETRLEYTFTYNFEKSIPHIFDERKYINIKGAPKGVGEYANYEVVYQEIE